MNLFEPTVDPNQNWLPHQGIVNYYGKLFSPAQADQYYRTLLHTIEWRNDEAVIFGRHIITKRKVAWYGDRPFAYTYSHITKQALPWTDALLELKLQTEAAVGDTFNSCLANLYHTGEEGMSWHSDDEKELKPEGVIASLSFGAERKFAFRHKVTKEVVSLPLEHGSLLVMKGPTQTHWLHRLPPSRPVKTPRINLTFRTIISG
jgi:alkylated DNA repair dioxygenase AlkB